MNLNATATFLAPVQDDINAIEALMRSQAEGHHPDLHLERYRRVRIELWTHAVDGLSENDFILAAKIDRLPARIRS